MWLGQQGAEPCRVPVSTGEVSKRSSLYAATEVAFPLENGLTEIPLKREKTSA